VHLPGAAEFDEAFVEQLLERLARAARGWTRDPLLEIAQVPSKLSGFGHDGASVGGGPV